jgi:hypothetical protein
VVPNSSAPPQSQISGVCGAGSRAGALRSDMMDRYIAPGRPGIKRYPGNVA